MLASIFVLVILYGLYNAKFSRPSKAEKHERETLYRDHTQKHKSSHFKEELSRIETVAYERQYIISVINHGSYDLGFRGGVMEGGYASREDAPKIACYVLEFSGKKCKEAYPANAEMFYTSICGGCHGNDGKGLNGNYPNLTKKKLLGIKRREAFLRSKISKSGEKP